MTVHRRFIVLVICAWAALAPLPAGADNWPNWRGPAVDGVAAGTARAQVAREHVAVADFHSLVRMIEVAARGLDSAPAETTEQLMERLYAERSSVLRRARAT